MGFAPATRRVILCFPNGTTGKRGPDFAGGTWSADGVWAAARLDAASHAATVPAPRKRSRRSTPGSSTGSSSIMPFIRGASSFGIALTVFYHFWVLAGDGVAAGV